MTEHVHEWCISARYYGGDSYAYCIKCYKDAGNKVTTSLSMDEVESRLNATERLLKYARLLDSLFVRDNLPLTTTLKIGRARKACADILEGK